jgi:hypothetical protein
MRLRKLHAGTNQSDLVWVMLFSMNSNAGCDSSKVSRVRARLFLDHRAAEKSGVAFSADFLIELFTRCAEQMSWYSPSHIRGVDHTTGETGRLNGEGRDRNRC